MGYSPILGRFLQRDPIGYDGGLNLFEYVRSNPSRFIDPYGLQAATTQPAAPTVIAKFGGNGGNVTKVPWGGGTLRLDTTGGTLDYQFFPGAPAPGVQSCFVPCPNQTWLHEIRIILPKGFQENPATNLQWQWIAGGEGADHGMNQVVYEEGQVPTNGNMGFVGDNIFGNLNLPYTGSPNPNAPPMSPNMNDGVGVPKDKYGNGNYKVVKQFIDIPLCNGTPLGPVIVTNLTFNPSTPGKVTVSGTVLEGPSK